MNNLQQATSLFAQHPAPSVPAFPPPRLLKHTLLAPSWTVLLLLGIALPASPVARAQDAPAALQLATGVARQETVAPAALEDTLRLFVDRQTAGLPGRVDISVGSLGSRASLPACAAMEPFIPTGARLWGRTALGMRCRDGASWSVLIPVQVRIYAPALQSVRPLLPGQPLGTGDYVLVETELTREPPGILTSADEIADQVLTRPLPAGVALRREQFRPRPVASAGDQVTLVYAGAGFAVSSAGKLLQSAAEGQAVRVQVESGRILSGIARAGRKVEVRP